MKAAVYDNEIKTLNFGSSGVFMGDLNKVDWIVKTIIYVFLVTLVYIFNPPKAELLLKK